MKLNQELLKKIQDEVLKSRKPLSKEDWNYQSEIYKDVMWPEVCRRYAEQIIKCDECEGTGEHEINVDGMDAPSADGCMFCEGKGYLDEKY